MEEEINLIDFYRIIKKRLKSVLILVSVFLIIALVYVLAAERFYKATSVIMPLGSANGNGGVALLAQVAGISSGGDPRGKSIDLSIILNSRSLAEKVVSELDLLQHYYSQFWDFQRNQWKENVSPPSIHDAAKMLLSRMEVKKDLKSGGVITIAVEDTDPDVALKLNKAILSELQVYLNNNAFTDAKRQRIFTGNQLLNNKRELLEIGRELGSFYQSNNISTVSPFVDVALGVPRVALNAELEALQDRMSDKIKEFQNKKGQIEDSGEELVRKVPQQIYLEYLNQKKQILTLLNGMFSQQYEVAKMQEVKEDVSFKIIDEAIKPKIPSRPAKKLILGVVLLCSLLVSFLYVFAVEYIQNLIQEKSTSS